TSEALKSLDEKTFLQVFDGVPTFEVAADKFPMNIIDLLSVETQVFPSKGECRKMLQGGGVSINKDKVSDVSANIGNESFIDGKYILAQRGKKNYYLIIVK
ncbi:MAG: tyrosine--tRNA ligase, partial [Bacteroidales bacterium]|nr:tyrosine--tRNA ligase [Bacteroidales bacterium]